MQLVDVDCLAQTRGGTARFVGEEYGPSVPGKGADKHRHPYEEIFVNLGGSIEVTVDDETRLVESGTIVVVPAGAWHGFKNRSEEAALMVNVHPAAIMVQEDWE
jgi:quercetin dioxygenase-like cupin family protein